MHQYLAAILLGLMILMLVAGYFAPLWIRREQTRVRLARIFLWTVFGGGVVLLCVLLLTGIRDCMDGTADSARIMMLSVFSLILTGVGSSILYEFVIKKRMELLQTRKLRKRFPDAPWKWSNRWRSNRLTYSDKGEMIFSHIIAAAFIAGVSLLSIVKTDVIITIFREDRGDSMVIIAGIFLGTFFALRFALNATIRWRKYGTSFFDMYPLPAIIGENLEGEIHTKCKRLSPEGFDVTLACVEMDISFRTSFHSIRETVIWESEKRIRIDKIHMGPYGISFPISITIPGHLPETDTISREKRISWVLNVSGAGDMHCLKAVFRVPVFNSDRCRRPETVGNGLSGSHPLMAEGNERGRHSCDAAASKKTTVQVTLLP